MIQYVQLYLLSIILNGLIGFFLVFEDAIERNSTGKSFRSSWGFRLVLGILAAIMGILKLLLPMTKPAILGDLLPALAGIVAGYVLIFGFYRDNSVKSETGGKLDKLGDTFLNNKKIVGIALLIVTLLHFLFPTALFL